MLLSHAERSRFISHEYRRRGGLGWGSALIDGVGRGVWRVERDRDSGHATLAVHHVGRLVRRTAEAVAAEGRRLLRLVAADAETTDVRLTTLD